MFFNYKVLFKLALKIFKAAIFLIFALKTLTIKGTFTLSLNHKLLINTTDIFTISATIYKDMQNLLHCLTVF